MIKYKGIQTFEFATVEDDACSVAITINFDNKKHDEESRNLLQRIEDSFHSTATSKTQIHQAEGDYVACFIRNLAQKIGELSIQSTVTHLLKFEELYYWVADPSLGVTFNYIDWSPVLELSLQECSYKEERPWKEW